MNRTYTCVVCGEAASITIENGERNVVHDDLSHDVFVKREPGKITTIQHVAHIRLR